MTVSPLPARPAAPASSTPNPAGPAVPAPASPVLPAGPSRPASPARPGSPVTQVALEYPPGPAADQVLEMLAAGARAPTETDRLAAVVNVEWLVQAAAAYREPASLAAFTAALRQGAAAGLASCALDVAAASREPADLARLAASLGEAEAVVPSRPDQAMPDQAGGADPADLAGVLLASVVRRRLPRDVAAVARVLDAGTAGRLMSCLVAVGRAADVLYVMLALRTRSDDALAWRLADAVTAQPDPAAVAAFASGLWAHGDQASASYVTAAMLRRDVTDVAGFVGAVLAVGAADLAWPVLAEAARVLAPADRIRLATLLPGGLSAAERGRAWVCCAEGLGGAALVAAFTALRQQAGPTGPAGLAEELREAARALPVELVAELARAGHRWPDDGGAQTILRAVAVHRPVPEIGELASCLLDNSERELAWELLNAAAQEAAGRDGVTDAADVMILLAGHDRSHRRHALRRDPWRWRDRLPGIIDAVAARRSPRLVMGMIDRLAASRGYDEHARGIRTAVAREFRAAELASLPEAAAAAGLRPHLPVVLGIVRQAVVNPEGLAPRGVPGLITALRAAGAAEEQLAGLLTSIGSHTYLEGRAIAQTIAALEQAGLPADAAIVRKGRRR